MNLIEYLSNRLKNELDKSYFDFSIDTQSYHDNIVRSYFYFFKDKPNWRIEIALPVLSDAWDSDRFDISKFLEKATCELLKKFEIECNTDQFVCLKGWDKDFYIGEDLAEIFFDIKYTIDSGTHIVSVISDRSKIGKTTFMQYYCKKSKESNPSHKVWWLDFNKGNANILNFLQEIYASNFENESCIILDNLECCGYTIGQKIADFFIQLTLLLHSKNANIKLFIIQDLNRKIINHDYKHINYFENTIDDAFSDQSSLNILNNDIYNNIKNNVQDFLNNKEIELSAKIYLIKIIYFSKYGVNIRINSKIHNKKYYDDCINNFNEIEKNIDCIKRMYDGEIISFTKEISFRLIQECNDLFCSVLQTSDTIIYNREKNSFNDNVLDCYYHYLDENQLKISIVDFYSILQSVNKSNIHISNYHTILKKAEDANTFIVNSVLSDDGKGQDNYFNYHLGAILFAGESLSMYSTKNWNSLRAWIKLHEHIKKTFYTEGQERDLPNIRYGREKLENTIYDFKSYEERIQQRNCIENQIAIHNEVLKQCKSKGVNELAEEDVEIFFNDKDKIKDEFFNFYVSPLQLQNSELNINIEKFYRTYILALLFEFEVQAPFGQKDIKYIKKLWEKIKNNFINENNNQTYFYPARVPWVTARMALAMSYCAKSIDDQLLANEIRDNFKNIASYLVKTSIKFIWNGNEYRFWSSGTGFWNSALETTILCAFALKEIAYGEYKTVVNAGIRFINLFKNSWFNEKMIADGIWAYQTTEVFSISNVYDKLREFVPNIKNVDFACNENAKNDKSLGSSHIAKTLIDLVYGFISVKPNLFNSVDDFEDSPTILQTTNKKEKTVVGLALDEVDKWIEKNNAFGTAKISELDLKELLTKFSNAPTNNDCETQRRNDALYFIRETIGKTLCKEKITALIDEIESIAFKITGNIL